MNNNERFVHGILLKFVRTYKMKSKQQCTCHYLSRLYKFQSQIILCENSPHVDIFLLSENNCILSFDICEEERILRFHYLEVLLFMHT